MKDYYEITEKLKDSFKSEPFVNTVSIGHRDDVGSDKKTFFPLTHLEVVQAEISVKTIQFEVNIKCMDLLDDDLSNENDIYNTQLVLISRVFSKLKKEDNGLEISQTIITIPLVEYQEDNLAGWEFNLTVLVPNKMTSC